MNNKTLIIADDHPLLLKGLGDFLKARKYNVLKSCKDGSDAWKQIIDLSPDFAILDIEMPYMTGVQIAEMLHQNDSKTKVILLSYQIETSLLTLGKKIGVHGFILKEDALSDIESCLESTSTYVSQSLAAKKEENDGDLSVLTKSEIRILKKIADGLSSREIAESFFLSERTVEKHRSNIISKLNLEGGQFSLLNWVTANKRLISKF